MAWHTRPKDDTWRQVTLAHLARLSQRLWLRCNGCGHSVIAPPDAFGSLHALPSCTPLLLIGERLVCSHCGERKGSCWPEPYGIPGSSG